MILTLTHEQQLIQRMQADPEGFREVYADYLEQHGRMPEAALLRSETPLLEAFAELAGWLFSLGEFTDFVRFRPHPGAGCIILASKSVGVREDEPRLHTFITQGVQFPFVPQQIAIPDSMAPHFDVEALWFGQYNQRPQGCVPATAFAASVTGQHRQTADLRPLHPGMTITINVVNTSKDPRPFLALIFGYRPRP